MDLEDPAPVFYSASIKVSLQVVGKGKPRLPVSDSTPGPETVKSGRLRGNRFPVSDFKPPETVKMMTTKDASELGVWQLSFFSVPGLGAFARLSPWLRQVGSRVSASVSIGLVVRGWFPGSFKSPNHQSILPTKGYLTILMGFNKKN